MKVKLKNKILTIFVLMVLFMTISTTVVFAVIPPHGNAHVPKDMKSIVKEEEGGFFEKIIAEMIAGLTDAVYGLATKESVGLNFKEYDELIFNKNVDVTSTSPFNSETWDLIMKWYAIIASVASALIIIAVVVSSYKVIVSSVNVEKRKEAKDSILRLALGGFAILLTPLFIRLLLLINNTLVSALTQLANSNLNDFMGEGVMRSITTRSRYCNSNSDGFILLFVL